MARLHDALPFTLVETRSDDPETVWVRDIAAASAVLEASVSRHPVATGIALQLLMLAPARELHDGLIMESLAYSALQGSFEFQQWLAFHEPKPPVDEGEGEPIELSRDGDELHISLNRPHKRNALNAAMREALLDAFEIALHSPEIRVTIDGRGRSFCAGGDLDEFGTFETPAHAHLVRIQRSLAVPMYDLRDRMTVRLHGRCAGAGIELPAFADRVVAGPDATFVLPELALGLIPGAGGTWSIPARIGPARTAWMLLSGLPVDAVTALEWGLIDAIDE